MAAVGKWWRALGAALLLLAVWIRVHDALHFPADWGFDSTFNWRYIYRLDADRALPRPEAGWATADPPLYFGLGAAVMAATRALGHQGWVVPALPLLGVLAGLGVVGLAASLVRRCARGDELRVLLAAGLLLYLPAHVQMSVMVNEEVLLALLVAVSLWLLALRPAPLAVGLTSGLALLTKLSGLVAVATAALCTAVEGLRRRAWRVTLRRLALLGVATLVGGGWWFVRNYLVYGWFQPHGMPAHRIMYDMPPGERGLLDYVYVPAATFSDPQLLDPDLLHSVWGSTYASLWFDPHRVFLPRDDPRVTLLGGSILLLGLLPTAAFGLGLLRGLRRTWRCAGTPDLPLLVATGVTLAGYVLYTWQNPWFAVLKATSLSALALPFAFYASEVLAGWLRRGRVAAWSVGLPLALLATLSSAASSFGVLFEKKELPGLEWRDAAEAPALPSEPGAAQPRGRAAPRAASAARGDRSR